MLSMVAAISAAAPLHLESAFGEGADVQIGSSELFDQIALRGGSPLP